RPAARSTNHLRPGARLTPTFSPCRRGGRSLLHPPMRASRTPSASPAGRWHKLTSWPRPRTACWSTRTKPSAGDKVAASQALLIPAVVELDEVACDRLEEQAGAFTRL